MEQIRLADRLSSAYAISLNEAKQLIAESVFDDDQDMGIVIELDFDGIQVVSSPFLRTVLTGFSSATFKPINMSPLVSETWGQVSHERATGVDIDSIINELGLDS